MGSFGFSISSNVVYPQEQLSFLDGPTIPLQRRTLERIVVGMQDIQYALEIDSVDELVRNYENGLNAKMCDALLEFANDGTHSSKFMINWSSFIDSQFNQYDCLWKLSKKEYEVINEASRRLQEFEPIEVSLMGKIVTLHTVHNIDKADKFSGTAYLKTAIDDRTVDVKMVLSRFNYKKALDAHMKGLEIVVKGELTKTNTVYELVNVSWQTSV